ncbi:hypothetical protein RhiJN_18638 [Ceratobasidium sp. AG-Ba]|nr:hypothetical protein RhiJN_18638 [Ceratobasidium sp. AG-Ba]
MRCNGSDAGKSDAIKNVMYKECTEDYRSLKPGDKANLDCFIVSRSKVLEGVGQYALSRSDLSRSMIASWPLSLSMLKALRSSLSSTRSPSLLQKLDLLLVLFGHRSRDQVSCPAQDQVQMICEQKGYVFCPASHHSRVLDCRYGLPLVCGLGSYETMANASAVCTDKTDTLIKNIMPVVAGSVVIHPHLSNTFNKITAVNSTAFEDKYPKTDELKFVGSKTETPLLRFAKTLSGSPTSGLDAARMPFT